MDNPVEEIKRRIDIVDFIGSFISLKKTGRNFKALCPFHQEKTPSFIVSPERQIWHCFGACNEGGDVIKFLMKWENITFFEALRELARKTGVQLKKITFEDNVWKKKERYIAMNQLAADFFDYLLHKANYGKKALDYLLSRHIKLPIIKKFQLGYAPSSWDSLYKFLKRKKFEEEEMFENGLLVKGEKGNFYDRFRGRIIFPIRDHRGNIIAFSGRLIDDKQKEAKYINTPETPIYHKRETLFGIDLAKEEIKTNNNVFIVEGEFDVISPHQHGFKNFVAIKGSALTKEQLMLLKRYTNHLTLALDTDLAGQEALIHGLEEAEQLDFEIEVINFDYAKDPDEAIIKDPIKFKKIISQPIPIYDFLIDFFKKRYPDDDPFSKKKLGEAMTPIIAKINNPIVQSHYIKKIASILEVSESVIERLIKKVNQRKKTANFSYHKPKSKLKVPREILIENYILSVILQDKDPYPKLKKFFSIIDVSDFVIPSHQKIFQVLINYSQHYEKFNLEQFIANLPLELKPIFDEIFLFASVEQDLKEDNFEKLVLEMKKLSLKRKIKAILLIKEEVKRNNQDLIKLTTQLKEVEKKLITL
jgi:DNA primase